MPFVKVVKNKAYFKRYQTKFKRRRQGRTDYYGRQRLVLQDKNKYDSPKYRLVARFTNTKVIAQVTYATLKGDIVFESAYSTELAKYGVKTGLKNYAAAYATGLLVARRALKKMGMDSDYEGEVEVTGEIENTEAEEDSSRNPFKVFLDVGLARTSTGCRLMAVAKGASDGGLYCPHNEKRFPGYERNEDGKGGNFAPEVLKARIFGNHVAEYMEEVAEESPDKYAQLYGKGGAKKNTRTSYTDAGVTHDSIEEMYKKCHAAIRADPTRDASPAMKIDKSFKHQPKRTNAERKAAVEAEKERLQGLVDAAEESEEDDE